MQKLTVLVLSVFTGKDCNGIEDPLSTDGRCMEKGKYNSYRCS